MNVLQKIMATAILFSGFTACKTKISNAKTEQFKIYGNCGMCQATIEKAGTENHTALVKWDKDTKIATLIYDSLKTNRDAILKRIALSGYDSDQFLAPDAVYAALPVCCHYERVKKASPATVTADTIKQIPVAETKPVVEEKETSDQLQPVFDSYFALKDALVRSDAAAAAVQAAKLRKALDAVKMDLLQTDEHAAWMKTGAAMQTDAAHIAETKTLDRQREYFVSLSENMYALRKAASTAGTVYYQHCPMYNDGKGANWLSREKSVKNPYYGSEMLTCGKTTETIQK